MASLPALSLYLLSLLLLFSPHYSFRYRSYFQSVSDDVHDLLPKYGFPRGLIPNAVKSYSLSSDGQFEIELYRPCYVQFDKLVYYDSVIKGKLSYGSVDGVSGIQAKKLFLWVSVTGIVADLDSGMIEFHAGAFSEKLPAEQFEKVPNCKNKGCQGQTLIRESQVQFI